MWCNAGLARLHNDASCPEGELRAIQPAIGPTPVRMRRSGAKRGREIVEPGLVTELPPEVWPYGHRFMIWSKKYSACECGSCVKSNL